MMNVFAELQAIVWAGWLSPLAAVGGTILIGGGIGDQRDGLAIAGAILLGAVLIAGPGGRGAKAQQDAPRD